LERAARLKLLLDTHVWLWSLLDPQRLSEAAEQAISDSESELCLSPISTWETLVLARKRRLELRPSPREWVLEALRRSAPTPAPLSHSVAIRSEALEDFGSQDPADRFLVATALEQDMALITADGDMRDYRPLKTVW
jgi:PIN domain nuclease of toxin-antitoxin system